MTARKVKHATLAGLLLAIAPLPYLGWRAAENWYGLKGKPCANIQLANGWHVNDIIENFRTMYSCFEKCPDHPDCIKQEFTHINQSDAVIHVKYKYEQNLFGNIRMRFEEVRFVPDINTVPPVEYVLKDNELTKKNLENMLKIAPP